MRFKILESGRFEDDQVPKTIGSQITAPFAADHKRCHAGYEPPMDSRARNDFNEWNAVVTPMAIYSEIHRGSHKTSAPILVGAGTSDF